MTRIKASHLSPFHLPKPSTRTSAPRRHEENESIARWNICKVYSMKLQIQAPTMQFNKSTSPYAIIFLNMSSYVRCAIKYAIKIRNLAWMAHLHLRLYCFLDCCHAVSDVEHDVDVQTYLHSLF